MAAGEPDAATVRIATQTHSRVKTLTAASGSAAAGRVPGAPQRGEQIGGRGDRDRYDHGAHDRETPAGARASLRIAAGDRMDSRRRAGVSAIAAPTTPTPPPAHSHITRGFTRIRNVARRSAD